MTIFWLVVLIVCIVIEAMTMGLTTVWFAGGALVALFVAVLNGPVALQIVLFVLVSLLMLFFTRPIAVKYFNKERVKTNAESLVGKSAIVTADIDNIQGVGQAIVGGQEWSARSYDDDVRISTGTVVEILSINGVKLIVKPDASVPGNKEGNDKAAEPMSVSQIEETEAPTE